MEDSIKDVSIWKVLVLRELNAINTTPMTSVVNKSESKTPNAEFSQPSEMVEMMEESSLARSLNKSTVTIIMITNDMI